MEVTGHGPPSREWEWSWEDFPEEWRLGRTCTHRRSWGMVGAGVFKKKRQEDGSEGAVGTLSSPCR